MEILKRLYKVLKYISFVLIILVIWPLVFIEIPFYSIKWILTGRGFPEEPFFLFIIANGLNKWKQYFTQPLLIKPKE
jgi:hypothetical protein